MFRPTRVAFVLAAALTFPAGAFGQTGGPPSAPDMGLPQQVLDRFTPQPTPTPAPTVTPTVTPTPTPAAPLETQANTAPSDGCTIRGTDGDDRLAGTPGKDVICGLGGNDVLLGKGGNDELIGGPGRDRLDGGAGRDRLRARDGERDRLAGGEGRDRADVDRRGDSLRGVERVTGRPTARASQAAMSISHSLLNCSMGLLVGSGDLMVYTSADVIVGVRDHVFGWTGREWRYLTSDNAAYTRPNGYVRGSDPVWYAPALDTVTSLGAFWRTNPGSGYYGVAQWIGVWDRASGRLLHVDYAWLENIHDGRPYCGF
jgi:hypothetical protein